jgi:gas vesicle protein GvpO
MADLSESQQKRAQARERRRKQPDKSGSDDGAENASQDNEQLNHAVRQAAKGAVAAAAVGAAAAAARKLASHDGGEPQPEEQEQAEPEPQQDEPQAQETDQQEPEEREADREPVAGAGESDARRVLDRARDQLQDLLGRPVESVSSLERTHDGWVLALEVVEVRRIPETTDILASYEMELDDDLNLRRYRQGRRYHRAHADGAEET